MADQLRILNSISIKGFKSIKNIEKLELRLVNLLIGANGTGKSNFIDIFNLIDTIQKQGLNDYTQKYGGADNILFFGSKYTSNLILELSFFEEAHGYWVCLAPNNQDILYVQDEKCWCWEYCWDGSQNLPLKNYYNPHAKEQYESQGFKQIFSYINNWRKHHFHDTGDQSPMKKTADLNDNHFLRSDGSNLPAYLLFLRERHLQTYSLICNTIKQVTPFFANFKLEPLRLNENKIRLEWIHKFSDQYFDVSSLSDGTLRFICLATLLLQPPELRPSIILLDEPELGLHPYAITLLASMIKSAAVDTQVIISTQSSLLLDHFEPEDILVTELEEGATTIKRLNAEELKQWLEEYSLGQLWEKNYFGGRPSNG